MQRKKTQKDKLKVQLGCMKYFLLTVPIEEVACWALLAIWTSSDPLNLETLTPRKKYGTPLYCTISETCERDDIITLVLTPLLSQRR